MRKVNPQRRLNFSWIIFFFVPQRVCPENSRKEGRLRRHADLFNCVTLQCFSRECPYSTELFSFSLKAFREKEKNSVLWRRTCESLCCSPGTSRGFFIYNDAMLRQISKLASVMSRSSGRTHHHKGRV